jgi:ribosome-associated protein
MNNTEPSNENSDSSNDPFIEPATSQPASLNRFMRVTPATPSETIDGANTPIAATSAAVSSADGATVDDRPFPRRKNVKEDSLELAKAAARVAIDNKGGDVLILDVCDQTALFDYFVLATGTSRRQLHAISEEIDDVLEKELKDRRLGIEGYEDSRWIVLDYGSVVIHLFDEETRSYYDLESLWGDAKVVSLSDLGLSNSSASTHSDN